MFAEVSTAAKPCESNHLSELVTFVVAKYCICSRYLCICSCYLYVAMYNSYWQPIAIMEFSASPDSIPCSVFFWLEIFELPELKAPEFVVYLGQFWE